MNMTKEELRMIVRDENTKSLNRFKKDLKDTYMTRGDCLSFHYGKPGKATPQNSMGKEKAKFWGAMAALITAISTLIGLIIANFHSLFRIQG